MCEFLFLVDILEYINVIDSLAPRSEFNFKCVIFEYDYFH